MIYDLYHYHLILGKHKHYYPALHDRVQCLDMSCILARCVSKKLIYLGFDPLVIRSGRVV